MKKQIIYGIIAAVAMAVILLYVRFGPSANFWFTFAACVLAAGTTVAFVVNNNIEAVKKAEQAAQDKINAVKSKL